MQLWSAQNEVPIGEIMAVERLWRLSEHWFEGRLSRDWKARTSAQSQQLLTDAGFIGSFWTLP